MESLSIKSQKGEFFIPYVFLDVDTGICEISGESYLEYTGEFYDQVIHWLKKYYEEVNQTIEFNFKLTYFNTSSFKAILSVLKNLKKLQSNGSNVNVNWYYPQDDKDMLTDAQDLAEGADLDINLIPYKLEYDDEEDDW